MKKLLLFLSMLLIVGTAYSQQFRMVGTASGLATVDDSTYTVSIKFEADQTGEGFIGTSVVGDGSQRMFFDNGSIYTVTAASNQTFAGADVTLVEYGTTNGAPPIVPAQGILFAHQDSEYVPSTPSNSIGATDKLFSAIQVYNGNITVGEVTEAQLADSTSQVRSEIPDSLSQVVNDIGFITSSDTKKTTRSYDSGFNGKFEPGEIVILEPTNTQYRIERTLREDSVDNFNVWQILDTTIVEENLFGNSERLEQGDAIAAENGNWTFPGAGTPDLSPIADAAIGPDGKRTAEGIYHAAGSNDFFHHYLSDTIFSGEVTYLSFWMRAGSITPSSGVNMDRVRFDNGSYQCTEVSINFTTSDQEWRYYTVELNAPTQDILPGDQWTSRINGLADGDTIFITKMSLTRDPGRLYISTPTKSTALKGRLFAHRKLSTYVDFSTIPRDTTRTQWQLLQRTVDRLDDIGGGVIDISNVEVRATPSDATLFLKDNVVIQSNYNGDRKDEDSKLGYIFADLNDSSISLIKVIPDTVNSNTIPLGSGLEDLRIEVLSPCDWVIDMGNSVEGTLSNVTIYGEYQALGGVRYGVESYLGSQPLAPLNNTNEDLRVFEIEGPALQIEAGTENNFYNSQFHRSNIGINVLGAADLDCTSCHVEKSDSTAINIENGRLVRFENGYIESPNFDPDDVDFNLDSIAIHIQKANTFRFNGNILSTAGNETDYVFYIDSLDKFQATYNRFAGNAIETVVYVDSNRVSRDIQKNVSSFYTATLPTETIDDIFLNDAVVFNSFEENNRIEKVDIADSLLLSDVQLYGKTNYIAFSDSIVDGNGTYNWNTGRLSVTENDASVPSGEQVAERFTAISGSLKTTDLTPTGITITAGNYYHLSFLARPGTESFNDNINLQIRETTTGAGIVDYDLVFDGSLKEWQTVEYVIFFEEAPTDDVQLKFDMDVSDYVWVSNFQITEGKYKSTYVKTTGTPVSSDSKITVSQKLTFDGDVEVTGNLTYPGKVYYFDNISSLLGTSLSVGDIAITKGFSTPGDGSGYTYTVQSDSIRFFTTDQKNVVLLSNGNYAVRDLKTKRKFNSYTEFKYLAPLLGLSGAVESITVEDWGEFNVSGTIEQVGVESNFVGSLDGQGTVNVEVDGFYLDTVSVEYSTKNIFRNSEHFTEDGNLNYGAIASTVFMVSEEGYGYRGGLGPGGKANAFSMWDTNDGALQFIPLINENDPPDFGEQYVFSFWAKMKNGTSGVTASGFNWFNSVDNGETISIDNPGEWTRYSVLTDIPVSTSGTKGLTVDFTGLGTDTILVSQLQLEKGSVATDYQRVNFNSTPSGEVLYINRGAALVNNSTLDLSTVYSYTNHREVNDEGRLGSDYEIIQGAINYCESGLRCNEVFIPRRDYYIDNMLSLSDNVVLSSSHTDNGVGRTNATGLDEGGARFIVTTQLDTVVYIGPVGANQAIGNTGLRNITIAPLDTIGVGVYLKEVNRSIIENVKIGGQAIPLNEPFATGFYFDVVESSDQYDNTISNLHINGAIADGIYYRGSNNNNFYRVNVENSNTAVRIVNGNGAFFRDGAILQNCDTALVVEGGRAILHGLYTEGSGQAIVQRGGSLSVKESTVQAGSNDDFIIYATAGEHISFEDTYIRGRGRIVINGVDKGGFYRVTAEDDLQRLLRKSSSEKLTLDFVHISDRLSDRVYVDKLGKRTLENPRLTSPNFQDVLFSESITLSSNKIEGRQTNYCFPSNTYTPANSVFVFPSGTNTDSIRIRQDNFTAPDGTSTAWTMVFDGASPGNGSITFASLSLADSFDIGDNYVFSYWVHAHQETEKFGSFTARPYQSSSSETESVFMSLEPNVWEKVYHTGTIVDKPGSGLSIRLFESREVSAGDSISFWNFQIEKGAYPTTSLETTSQALSNSEAKVIGDIQLQGDLTVTGEITGKVNSTGWAQYGDNTFTSGSPLTVAAGDTITLPIDALTGVIETYLPNGVDSLWSAADSTILAQNVGDAYTVRVNFTAESNNVNGYFTQAIDIGSSTPIWITSRVKTFPKGAGTAHSFSSTDQIYSLSTFVANGGKIKIAGGVGTTSIYDINILITRVHSE